MLMLMYHRMDAISFVLGIKSSHLRSAHLRDLVYRGRVLKTATINEDGSATTAVNGHANGAEDAERETIHNTPQERNDPKSAWVMAVYEDDAGDEQHWKRTITNQGASEYRINNRVVTAQQYNEGLEAENILIKARNFLVFQGDVEAIAAQSPRDLTKLIEQISGSLEYKVEYERLKEAQEEAIENQNYNLNRRRGINSEIKQYQEQKREADSYARKADQRDQAIVTHILWKLYRFKSLMEESEVEIQKHQDELKEHRRNIAKYETKFEEARKEQLKVGRDVNKLERAIATKEKDMEEKERNLVPITEKIHLARDTIMKGRSRVGTVSKERDNKSEVLARLVKDLKVVEKAESQWEAEWKNLSQKEGRALSETDLQRYNKLKEEVSRQTSADKIKADNLDRQMRADSQTVDSLRSKLESIEYQIGKFDDNIASILENKTAAGDLIKQTTKDTEQKKKEYNSLASERLRVAQLKTELDEKLQQVLNKLVDAEYGRKQSDKELKLKTTIADMKRIFPGVRGRLSDLCKPKQKRYEIAVSTVLGRHFDAIVVDDEKTAKECIQFLREQRRGQATFIPLDTIQVKAINSNLKGMHRGTRMAIDTIDFDKSVDRAMSYACGNAIVCDDLPIAKYVCYEKGVDAKAVTLDGTVIHKAGLMTGGRGKEQNSRRWEDADVDSLRNMADKYRNDLAALPDSRRNANEEEALQSILTGLDQKLVYAKEELKANERNLAGKQKELAHAKRELTETRPTFTERQRELEELRSDLKTYQDSIGQIEDAIFAEFCQRLQYNNIREYEAQQGSLQQEAAQKKLEFKQQKSRLENRSSLEKQQLQEIENRIKSLEKATKDNQAYINDLEDEKESISNEADTLAAEVESLKERLEELQELHTKKTEKVGEQRREVQKRSKHVESTGRAIAGLKADIQRSGTDHYALLRRCKLEDITVPLAANSRSLDQLPIDGIIQGDADAMDVDEDVDGSLIQGSTIPDYGIEVDFDDLDAELKEVGHISWFLPLF